MLQMLYCVVRSIERVILVGRRARGVSLSMKVWMIWCYPSIEGPVRDTSEFKLAESAGTCQISLYGIIDFDQP